MQDLQRNKILQWERGFTAYIHCLNEKEKGITGRNITKQLHSSIRKMISAVGIDEVKAIGVKEALINKAIKN